MKRLIKIIVFFSIIVIAAYGMNNSNCDDNDSRKCVDSQSKPKISLAYVEGGRSGVPDDSLFTHYIYAFAAFNDNNDGLIINYPDKLRKLSDLKNKNPKLKIILGVGGGHSYKREGFSEMARSGDKRLSFAKSCYQILTEYNLDGVDLDWEFPTTEKGGHTASPEDDVNYGFVVKQLREILGKDKWISFYSNHSAQWIDFDKMLPYVDYVNVSGYNLYMPGPDKRLVHQSPLYPSEHWGKWCIEASIKRHIEKGVPPEKIILGIPFYGRGKTPFPSYLSCYNYDKYTNGCVLAWDDEAKVPYYVDSKGNFVFGFDNEKSIQYKCDFIYDTGLAGAFVWNYDTDFTDHRLAKSLHEHLINRFVCKSHKMTDLE